MKRILYSITITLLTTATLHAQAPPEVVQLSLQDAMNYAVKNHISIKNARLDYKIQAARNAEITGIALPQISGKGEFADYLNPIKSFVPAEFVGGPAGTFIAVPFTPKYSTNASISGSQLLFDGTVLVALQARKAILQLLEQSASLTEQELRYNVQNAYYASVIAQRQFNILINTIASTRNIAYQQQRLYEEGFAEKIDVDRINVQVNNLATDSLRTASMIAVSELLLKYTIGMPMSQPIVLSDTAIEVTIEEAQQLLLQDVNYEDRTEFSLLNSQLLLKKYDLKRHQYSGLPTLAAIGNMTYTYSTNTFSDLFNKPYIFYSLIGLQLKVPIFDGLQRRNRVLQAKYSMEKTRDSLDFMRQTIDFQEQSGKTSLRNSLLTLQNQERNLQLAQSVVDLAEKKYRAGVGSTLELSQAQTELLKSQNNYFTTMQELIKAKTDLQKALGRFKP